MTLSIYTSQEEKKKISKPFTWKYSESLAIQLEKGLDKQDGIDRQKYLKDLNNKIQQI